MSLDKRIKMQSGVSKKEGGLLVRLWRKILDETNYINSIGYLVDKYINESNQVSSVRAGKRQTKSSLIKNITTNNMSWRTFVSLLTTFLKVKDAKFYVKLTFHNGDTNVYGVDIDTSNIGSFEDIVEEEVVEDEINVKNK